MSNPLAPAPIVLYEDNHLLVVNKPAGIPTQSDRSGGINLLDLCREYIRVTRGKKGDVFLGMVHRLDHPVGGVIVFARTSKAAARLSAQFRNGEVDKRYRAVVEGYVSGDCELTHYLVRDGSLTRALSDPIPGAREAQMRYTAIESGADASLIDITLLTGRKHQIRAQLRAIGHPVLGDRKYGSRISFGEDRIALMCRSLEFTHPTRGERMRFEAGEPEWWPRFNLTPVPSPSQERGDSTQAFLPSPE
jgi:23S rRNA pseudouridine1911/1915/1917 synthase